MEQNRIKERLLKMYRLATDGVDGEKETAQKIENLNDVRPYDFETEREKKWYEIGLIDGKEAADVKYAKFASYEDKTYITDEWLRKNNFEFKIGDKDDPDYYLYCDDVVEITIILSNEEAGIWEICIQFLDHGDTEVLNICTLGQFRMFLAIEGLNELAKQLK